MLTEIHPKLPMRDKSATREYYLQLGFTAFGSTDYPGYLMLQVDQIQIHFFEFRELDPFQNYGQVYIRTNNIQEWYDKAQRLQLKFYPLETKPWGQLEFSLLDPDHNLLTFGQSA